MNKNDLVNKLAEKLGIPHYISRKYVNAFEEVVSEALKQDDAIMLQGFGSFEPWKQTKRAGRNPRTGETCMIEPRTSVKFRPGKFLLENLNS
ncbi:MAG: HU family DNA-binding protein [Parabacteroides gordonii]|uniref:HU family DNA-binding protein n=1 Tax=Parabacteroides gordonii TaxID=574930 RepID=UPI003A872AF8